MDRKGGYEMALRVKRIEQQMDALPAQWKQFAGKPMDMHYYGTKINTFRDNPELQPSKVYMRFAIKELKQQMSAYVSTASLILSLLVIASHANWPSSHHYLPLQ